MKKRRPRRTNEEITQAIHAAVISLVKTKGFAGLTFEGVARRCRMSKPVLYRRYANRADMFLDAIGSRRSALAFPDPTGALREDLIAWFEVYQKSWFASPTVYRGLVGEASDETLAKITEFETSVASLMNEKIIRPAKVHGRLGCFTVEDDIVLAAFRVLRDLFIFGGKRVNMERFVGIFVMPLLYARSGWIFDWKHMYEKDLKERFNAEFEQTAEKSDSDSPEP
jgi:AcrR family transcriptional regulator